MKCGFSNLSELASTLEQPPQSRQEADSSELEQKNTDVPSPIGTVCSGKSGGGLDEDLCIPNNLSANNELKIERAFALVESSRYNSALTYLDNYLKQHPTDYDAFYLLGRCLINLGDPDSGIRHVKMSASNNNIHAIELLARLGLEND